MSFAKRQQPDPVQAFSGLDTVTATNAAAVLTFPAPGDNYAWVLPAVVWSYSAAPTGGALTVTDGTSTYFQITITAAGPGFIAPLNFQMQENASMVLTLADGGAAVVGKLNAYPYVVGIPPEGTTNLLGALTVGQLNFSNAQNSGWLL